MQKVSFLVTLDAARNRWEAALKQIDQKTMLEPGAAGAWTVKDIIAHIVWHERQMATLLETRSLDSGSKLWELPLDERNARIYDENRKRPLDEALNESREAYSRLRALLDRVTDEDLNDPGRFKGMPGEWKPWKILAENTYEHYDDHLLSLQHWAQEHPR